MLLEVQPLKRYSGIFEVPSSKPETQRAILMAALADGESKIYNDLRCSETETMKNACKNLGAKIIEHDEYLEVHGIGGNINYTNRVIDCKGSGLVFRTFTALASTTITPIILSGDKTLCNRVMSPLFDGLKQLGAKIESICKPGMAPIVNWGRKLRGGKCTLPGNISSQFITAILIAAPFALEPVEIIIDGDVYSQSYIKQTLEHMSNSGISVEASEDYKYFKVYPGNYVSRNTYIKEDYTSASYILACAALFQGKTILKKVHGESLQGEQAILDILKKLGLSVILDENKHELIVNNVSGKIQGDFEFNAMDFPNIVPTLAAIGAYVEGRFRVVGASITRFHKASRVEAIAFELKKLGVDITLLEKDGVCDGFEIRGRSSYSGDTQFSSWGDHRIFMSLFIASLKAKSACYLAGHEDVHCSFPTFLTDFKKAGVKANVVSTNTLTVFSEAV